MRALFLSRAQAKDFCQACPSPPVGKGVLARGYCWGIWDRKRVKKTSEHKEEVSV